MTEPLPPTDAEIEAARQAFLAEGEDTSKADYPVFHGISYPLTFRATPGRNPDGMPAPGQVMWSVDMDIRDGVSLTASAGSIESALWRLSRKIIEYSVPYPGDEIGSINAIAHDDAEVGA